MENLIINILVSSGFASLVSGIFVLLNKRADFKNEVKKAKFIAEKEYKTAKEIAYINAVNSLLFFKRGFSITHEDLLLCEKEHEEYAVGCKEYRNAQAVLRLYATDEIFNLYYSLLSYRKFAYVSKNQWRLSENDKDKFDAGITLLSRMIQKELGYRNYDKSASNFTCPECGRKHDFLEQCKCGLTYDNMIKKFQFDTSVEDNGVEKEFCTF